MIRICFIVCLFISCTASRKGNISTANMQLRFLGKYDLPHKMQFRNTTVGGLSGIDYNHKKNIYYLICDDRSAINPARFYTAKIFVNEKGIDSVKFIDVVSLLQPNGNIYPNSKQDPYHTPDPEGIRYNPQKNELVWTSEGERIIKKNDTVLADPSVIIISPDGKFKDSFVLPPNMHMQIRERGPRQNSVFEGLTFLKDYTRILVSVEEPLYEDGPRAGLGDSSGVIRIIEFDVKTRRPLAEYAYQIDPVAYPANPPG